ncbi:hypothetical protein AB3X91_11890 [Paraburkholderia sp. BR14263]|uniref:hypothetical protein n=1 Tax=unclassified Paraburkholderia TaxID=2615204 RepID=UPI0034CFF01A
MIALSAARGDGSEGNPERTINLYFSLDGRMLACYDPLNGPPDGFFANGRAPQPTKEMT